MKKTILLISAGLVFLSASVSAAETVVMSAIEGSTDAEAAVAVIGEAYKNIGYEIDIKWYPGSTALEKSSSGEVDAELQRIDGISQKYPDLIQIPIPINFLQASVFVTDVTFTLDGWYSLKPYRIGIVKGVLFAEQGTQGMDVRAAGSYSELLEMLEKKIVDVAVMPRVNGLAAIKQQKIEGIRELNGVLEILFLYHYVHKKNSILIPKLQKVLKEMLLNGTTRRLWNETYAEIIGGEY